MILAACIIAVGHLACIGSVLYGEPSFYRNGWFDPDFGEIPKLDAWGKVAWILLILCPYAFTLSWAFTMFFPWLWKKAKKIKV
jgi:hypothetical protein